MTYLGVGRITEVTIIIAIIDSYEREREIQRFTGMDERRRLMKDWWYTPAQALVTTVRLNGSWPAGERPSRYLHAAASRTAEERERVRMRAHHACHLILMTGQNTMAVGEKKIRNASRECKRWAYCAIRRVEIENSK